MKHNYDISIILGDIAMGNNNENVYELKKYY